MTKLYRISKKIFGSIDRIWYKFELDGLENIPEEGRLIVAVAGHACNGDAIHLGLQHPRELHFMAKGELFDVPILSSLVKGYNAFSVKRGRGCSLEAIEAGLDKLRKDQDVAMFVEEVRTKTGELGRVRTGTARMALMAIEEGIPVKISPCLLQGTYGLYPAGIIPRRKQLKLSFNETIDTSKYDSIDRLTTAIHDSIQELK
ncbi:MAG: 1-acyl-sn-glycerol-3-phosphate acyltransferase [Nanoarchaeota archaeon]|nr:1-acyl-sn-glycerol-3-phosphate acyltransferase [Nanoarchaeota archaeon]